MNGKVTLALIAAATLAVAYLVWFDRDRPGTQTAALAQRTLLPPGRGGRAAAPIDRLEIVGPDGRIELAMGPNREWQVLAPMADRADLGAVRELVEALETALKFDTMPAGPADLEKFGLHPPTVSVRIHRGGEDPIELLLGVPTAVEGRGYAKLAGSPDVVVVPDEIRQMARRSPDDFRDGQLLKVRPVDVSRITIRNVSGTIELQRERGRWEMIQPVAARADDKAVNDWLDRLCASGIRQFVGPDLGNLISYGLAAPRGLVRLEFESPTDASVPAVEISFGNRADPRYAPDSVYVRASERRLVAAVPLTIEEALLLDADALRERTLFLLNPDLVDRVRIQAAGREELVLARRDDDWTMLKPVPAEVEATEVMRLLKRLPEIRVREFFTADAATAATAELDPPRLRVTFASFSSENTPESTAGETPIATLSFGAPRPDGSLLVRVEGQGGPVVARVDADVLSVVSPDPIAWRPLRLFGETPVSIEALTVEAAGGSREFRRDGGSWRRLEAESAIAPTAIASAAALISRLRAVRWVGPAVAAHGLDAPTLMVRARAEAGSEALELRVGRRTPEGLWPATLNGRTGVFLLSDPDYQILKALTQ